MEQGLATRGGPANFPEMDQGRGGLAQGEGGGDDHGVEGGTTVAAQLAQGGAVVAEQLEGRVATTPLAAERVQDGQVGEQHQHHRGQHAREHV